MILACHTDFPGEAKEHGVMRERRKSISVQSQMCGDTQIVVLVVREMDGELKKTMTKAGKQVRRITRKVVRYLNRTWFYILIGLWLTVKAIDAAYEFRGYEAVGSEYLVLPMFLLLVEVLRAGIRFYKEV